MKNSKLQQKPQGLGKFIWSTCRKTRPKKAVLITHALYGFLSSVVLGVLGFFGGVFFVNSKAKNLEKYIFPLKIQTFC